MKDGTLDKYAKRIIGLKICWICFFFICFIYLLQFFKYRLNNDPKDLPKKDLLSF